MSVTDDVSAGEAAAAAVQARALDEAQLNTLFWCHLGLGIVLAVVAAGLAPLAARFYATPSVAPLLLTMSVAFLAIGAGGFARSQLERAVRFAEIGLIEGIAALSGTLIMIAAAAFGAGAYSFAAYLLVFECVAAALAWRALQWRPQAGACWSSVRGFWRAGPAGGRCGR